jgi:hypothetical protein
VTNTATNEQVLDRSIFAGMTPVEQQQYHAEFGFVLLPSVVSAEQISQVAVEAEAGNYRHHDYIKGWPGPALQELITNPELLELLRRCYGEDLRFFKSVYAEWRDADEGKKRLGRQRLHRDYTPEPADGDYRNSCASWCNVGHYLIDLKIDEGPLWVVPGSHKIAWTHTGDDLERVADDARLVLAKAGDAVMFHNFIIHAGGLMRSGRPRPSVFQSYRPAWAAPLGAVPEWPEQVVAKASPDLRQLLLGQNDGVRVDAYGVAPSSQ